MNDQMGEADTSGSRPAADGLEDVGSGATRPDDGTGEAPVRSVRPLEPGELGRDLTLLALAIVIINEAIFTAQIVLAGEQHILVAQAGRFAVRAGLAYMTWQGFVWSRWLLAFLVAVPALAGPWQLASAFEGGITAGAIVMTATVIGYFVATWLLAGSPRVAAFLRYRRLLRTTETS